MCRCCLSGSGARGTQCAAFVRCVSLRVCGLVSLSGIAKKRRDIVIIVGILVIFASFVYDVLFAGIPYQDPTPGSCEGCAQRLHLSLGLLQRLGVEPHRTPRSIVSSRICDQFTLARAAARTSDIASC